VKKENQVLENREKMADPTVCSGDEKCKCRRTQETLDADKEKRIAAMKAADPISKVSVKTCPDDGVYIVHYADGEWLCSSKLCGHPISVHPAAAVRVAAPAAEAVAQQRFLSPSPSSAQAMSALEKHVTIANPLSAVPKQRLQELLSDAVSDPPASGKENDVQKWLVEVAAKLDPTKAAHVLAASLIPPESLHVPGQPLKPDGVIYTTGGQDVEGCALAAIELKKSSEKLTADNPTLQLFNYLHAILHTQPHRIFCFGLLLNGVNAMLYRATRDKKVTKYVMQWSGAFTAGQAFLAWLLSAPLADLGYCPPRITLGEATHELTTFIGSGQHCAGYELCHGGAIIVVKHYTDADKAENERTICQLLRGVTGVAQLHTVQPREPNFVAVTPRGYHFDAEHPVREAHVECLCAALAALHDKGKVHADICGANIYWLDESTALLNDWSHTTDVSDAGREKDFGALMEAIRRVGGDVPLLRPILPLCSAAGAAAAAGEKPLKKARAESK
jgi:hypothetical protein